MFVRTGERIARAGIAPAPRRRPGQRRARALVQLIAAVGLVISLAVMATAVSFGIARAHGISASVQHQADTNAHRSGPNLRRICGRAMPADTV